MNYITTYYLLTHEEEMCHESDKLDDLSEFWWHFVKDALQFTFITSYGTVHEAFFHFAI